MQNSIQRWKSNVVVAVPHTETQSKSMVKQDLRIQELDIYSSDQLQLSYGASAIVTEGKRSQNSLQKSFEHTDLEGIFSVRQSM